MPIDPTIALGVQAPPIQNPLAIANQVQQYQLGRAQMQTLAEERAATAADTRQKAIAAQRQNADEMAVRAFFAKRLQAQQQAAPLSSNDVTTLAGQVGFDRAKAISDGLDAMQQTRLKTEGDVRSMVGTVIGGIQALPPTLQADAYQNVTQEFVRRGLLQPGDVQPYSPQVLEMYRQQAMSPKEQGEETTRLAQLPGQQAQSAIQQQVAAGMRGGLTPEQQTTAAQQAATEAETARHNRASEAVERQKATIAQQTFNATYGSGLDANGQPLAPDAIKAQAQHDPQATAIANYQIPPISPRMEADPKYRGLMQRILALNPSYDATQYQNRQKARIAFTTGTQGQQLNAMNTAMLHLDLLSQAAQGLQNGSFTPGNALYNKVATLFGASGPIGYTQIKHYLDGEVGTLVKKGAVTDQELRDEGATGASSSSPAQIQTYLQNAIRIAASKAHTLQYQAGQALGDQDPTVTGLLMPEVKGVLQKHGFNPDGSPVAAGSGGGSGPQIGERRMINGQLGEWDGRGWKAVSGG